MALYREDKKRWLRNKADADFLACRYWEVVPSQAERDHALRIIESGFAHRYGEAAAKSALLVLRGERDDREMDRWGIEDPREVLRRLREYDPEYAWKGPPL